MMLLKEKFHKIHSLIWNWLKLAGNQIKTLSYFKTKVQVS